MSQQRYQGLRTGVATQALVLESQYGRVAGLSLSHQLLWRELPQQPLIDGNRKTGITALYRMTDPIAFVLVEEHDLVCLAHHLITTEVTHKNALVGKHEEGGLSAF